MNILSLLNRLFEGFLSFGQLMIDFIDTPLLPDGLVSFVDSLPNGWMDILGISSSSEITFLWVIVSGFVGVAVWTFITWLLNIVT